MRHVFAVVDCGDVVNPDSAMAQVEGGIIFGLSAALLGEITIAEGRVVQRNFRDHQMIHMADAPRITAEFIQSDARPGGLGEPCVPPVAPAVDQRHLRGDRRPGARSADQEPAADASHVIHGEEETAELAKTAE